MKLKFLGWENLLLIFKKHILNKIAVKKIIQEKNILARPMKVECSDYLIKLSV